MKEKLIIKNFGPIKSVELEFSRFNILIGEQATGKSTVAKLLAVCRYFSYIINVNSLSTIESENNFSQGLAAWGLAEFVKSDSYIFYECKHYSLTVKNTLLNFSDFDPRDGSQSDHSETIFLPQVESSSKEFTDLLRELERIKPKSQRNYIDFSTIDWTAPTSFFQNDVASVMDNPFYLYTERGLQSIFSLGKSSISNINDSLFNQFARLDQIARLFTNETNIEPLEIIYKNEAGKGFVRKNDENEFYSLANGASGYQSAIPIILAIRYYTERSKAGHRKKSKTFIIEEPELNLFPATQDKMMRFLVQESNKSGHTMFLTTHSPYTLTSLNNLLYAAKIGAIQERQINETIKKNFWLDENDLSAYKLNPDGTCENIFDHEEGMIKAEKIDVISSILNEEFDNLMNIEFSKNELNT